MISQSTSACNRLSPDVLLFSGSNTDDESPPLSLKPISNTSRVRKRTFSPKVRTGCSTCKTRKIKCDEGKPICRRCQKSRFTCQYDVPKTWIFEKDPSTTYSPSIYSDKSLTMTRRNNGLSQANELRPAVQDVWCTPEERRSIAYWVANTGPWLGNYAGKVARYTWEVILPRCAQQLPAAKHMIVAVAMLDERLSEPSTQLLERRSRRILNHYNAAIKTLTSGNAAQLDILLSSMIAWVLEIMSDDPQRAKIHLDASGRLLSKAIADSPSAASSEEHDIIHHHITIAHQQCVGYAKTEPRQDGSHDPSIDSVFPALVSRNNPQTITSISQIKSVIKEYYHQMNKVQQSGIDIAEARQYRRSYEIALLKYRHVAREPPSNIIAVHYWLNLANNLLPHADNVEIATYRDVSGMDYLLDRVEDLYKTEGLSQEHRKDLEDTLKLMLINVIRFASEEKHVMRARSLMRMLDQIG